MDDEVEPAHGVDTLRTRERAVWGRERARGLAVVTTRKHGTQTRIILQQINCRLLWTGQESCASIAGSRVFKGLMKGTRLATGHGWLRLVSLLLEMMCANRMPITLQVGKAADACRDCSFVPGRSGRTPNRIVLLETAMSGQRAARKVSKSTRDPRAEHPTPT